MARRARRPRSQGAGEPDFEDRVTNPCVAAGIASHLRDRPRPPLPAPWTWGHLVPLPLDLGWPYRLKSRPRDQCEGPSGAAETQSRSCVLGRLCRRTRTPCGSRTGGDPEGQGAPVHVFLGRHPCERARPWPKCWVTFSSPSDWSKLIVPKGGCPYTPRGAFKGPAQPPPRRCRGHQDCPYTPVESRLWSRLRPTLSGCPSPFSGWRRPRALTGSLAVTAGSLQQLTVVRPRGKA